MLAGPIDWWLRPFLDSEIMANALVAGLLVVITTSVIGTWVVLRGLSFLGDALAHGVLPGVAIALILGASPILGALVAAMAMVALLTTIRDRSPLPEDVSIGVLFVGFLAAAVVILSSNSGDYLVDLDGLLFGSIQGVGTGDLIGQAVVAAVVLLGVAVFHRPFVTLTFDRNLAELLGLKPRLAHGMLMVLLALAIVASFQAVGNLLVFAFLIAPPATAVLLVKRIPSIMALSAAIGSAAVITGLLVAYHGRTAAEATMALVAVMVYVVTVVAKPLLRR